MPNETNELNRWIGRVQRKLDSMALTKLDREELEEMLAIVVNLAQRPEKAQTEAAPQPVTKSSKTKEASHD